MKDKNIANLKAVMLLGIFISHSFSAMKYIHTPQFIPAELCEQIAGSLTFCLGAFFCISGYFVSLSENSWNGYLAFLRKKVKTLLIPYFLWNVIYIAAYLIGGAFLPIMHEKCVQLSLYSISGILDTLFGITHNPGDGPLWYIRNLFFCILLYPMLRCLLKGKSRIWIIAVIAVGLGLIQPYLPSWSLDHFRSYILPSFCLGVYLRENDYSLHIFDSHGIFIAILFIFSYAVIFSPVLRSWYLPEWILERKLIYLPLLPCWLYLSQFLNFPSDSVADYYLVRPAFFIYASHALLGTMILRIAALYIPESPFQLFVLIGLYIVGGSCLILCSDIFLRRFFPKLYRILNGGRNG